MPFVVAVTLNTWSPVITFAGTWLRQVWFDNCRCQIKRVKWVVKSPSPSPFDIDFARKCIRRFEMLASPRVRRRCRMLEVKWKCARYVAQIKLKAVID
jgi:hypothetical protein